jgi:RND superfamily putative drug exporter
MASITPTEAPSGPPRYPSSDVSTRPARETIAAPYKPDQPRSALTAFCIRHRWLVLLLSVVALAAGGFLASTGITTTPPQDQLVGDSALAEQIREGADFGTRPTETVVVTLDHTPNAADTSGVARDLRAAYSGVSGISAVGQTVPGADGRSLVTQVTLDARATDDDTSRPTADEAVGPMLEATAAYASAHPDLQVGQVGDGSVDKQLGDTLGKDFQRAELFSIPLTLVILLIAFGAVVAAGVPLVLGLLSVGVAMGLTAAASQGIVSVDPNAQSLILLIGLAVGVDYALFVVRRAREERAQGAEVRDSIAIAGATAGRAVVISGLTVIVAMSGMLVAGGLYTSLALGAMLVCLCAVIASATTLPAILAILGDKVDAIRLPGTRRRWARSGSEHSLWGRLAGRVSRRPVVWGGVAAAVLVGLAVPALGMQTALGGVETLPQDLPVVQAYHQLERAVPSDGTAVTVVVKADAANADEVATALGAGASAAAGIGHVTGVAPEPTVSKDGTVSVLPIGVGLTPSSENLPAVVADVRSTVVPAVSRSLAAAGVTGAQVHVGGEAAATDLASWMDSRLPWVVAFVLTLTLVVMLVSFGSPWLAVATVALNVLSVGAAYGVMTLVFQGTWAESLLDFTSTGSIAAWLPMLMFVVLFGLSMDYHVFVTSRVREAFDAGLPARDAVRRGVARSAGVVTSAAAVMVAVFSIFGTLSSLEMKQLGVGLAVAVLLDATVVRGVLLPATLSLLGRRAHTGPKWLPTLHH